MDPSSSRQPTGDRSELLRNAVLFLTDPKVQSSTLASKIGFLESKGLTEGEIQDALRQATSSGEGTSVRAADGGGSNRGQAEFATRGYGSWSGYGTGTGYGVMPPEPPRRDWRDLFIMAVISGGVLYGLTSLARKYLLPHLRPPSSTAFQQTSSDLTAQYDEAARLLSELQTQTEALQAGLEGERERVRVAVEDVEEAVRGVREGEERWREEMREIRGEVESVRELVPRLIEKHAAAQSTSLSELQSELRSLKTLLQSRQAALSTGPSGPSGPSPPGAHPASSPHANGTSHGAGATTPGTLSETQTQTQRAANALLAPKGKGKGIPAWQMAGPDKAKDTATTTTSPVSGSTSLSASVSEAGSLAGSGVLPDKSDE